MAGKRKLLKSGALFGLLLLLILSIVWWRLPDVLNVVVNHQIEKQGFEDSSVVIRSAGHNQLTIQGLSFNSPGWSLELSETQIGYSLRSLLSNNEVRFADIDTFSLSVNPAELPSSDKPLTIEVLQSIPVQETRVQNGILNLEVNSGTFQIHWSGSLSISDPGIVTLHLTGLEIKGTSENGESILSLPVMKNDELLELKVASNGSEASTKWQFPSLNVSGKQWQITEGSTSGDLQFEDLNLQDVPLTDLPQLLERLTLTADGSISSTINETVFGTHSAQWITGEFKINPDESSDGSRSDLSINAGIVNAAGQSIEQVSLQLGNRGDLDQLETQGILTFLFEGLEGKLNFNHTTSDMLDELSLDGEYTLSPLPFDYSDLPGRYIPGFEDMLFTGEVAATGNYSLSNASAKFTLADGSISIPRNKLEMTGIDGTFDVASFRELRSEQGNSKVTIDLVKLGDLNFENTQFLFDLLDSKTLSLTTGSTELFDGTLRLSPGTFVINPTQVESSIAFEQLSLKAIVEGMDLFDGTMEGAISGHLPIRFKNGRFETSAGYLELSEGIPAKLNYNTKGMFAPKEPKKKNFLSAIGDKILEKLKLAPENVVEDALSDLTIHELRIDLLPEDSPGTPARIHLAGEGVTGKTKVPLILDTNINGTTDELLQFLLRIHSLGTPSL